MRGEENSNVISIGDWAVEHKRSYGVHNYMMAGCNHNNMVMNDHGQYVDCKDCGKQLSAYWALGHMLDRVRSERQRLHAEKERLKDESKKTLHYRAAVTIERAWRSKSMVPTCPHCKRGILPSDGFGTSLIHRSIDERQRVVKKES